MKSPPGEDTSTILKTQWQIVKDLNLLNSASDNENESNAKDSSEKGKVATTKPTPVKTPPAKTVEPSKSDNLFNCPICNHTCDETSKLEEHINR